MKVDGKKIAQEMKKKKESYPVEALEKGDAAPVESEEEHLSYLSRFIDAVHEKDTGMAHKHLMDYAKSMPESK